MSTRRGTPTQVASSVPFDKDNAPECEFVSDNVQSVIEELCSRSSASASPGFTWGASGNTTPNSWLLNDTVPSNRTGRNFALYNGELVTISVSNDGINTFDIEVYEHDGTTFTLLATISVVAARTAEQTFTGVNITRGKELAIKQTVGSSKNPVVQVIAKGTLVP